MLRRTFFFGGGGHFGLKAQSGVAMFFLCLPSSLSLNFYKEEKKKLRKKKVGGWGEISKFSHAYISAYADNLPVCRTFNHTFSTPQKQSLLSPWRILRGKQKPQIFRYFDLTNQQAISGLSQRMQWRLPPLTTLWMNNINNSIKKLSPTLDTKRFLRLSDLPVLLQWTQEQKILSRPICYMKSQ